MEKISQPAKEIRQIQLPIEIRTTSEGEQTREIQGYAAKYNSQSQVMYDIFGDPFVEEIAEGAFDNSLNNNVIRALWNHNHDYVLGSSKSQTLKLESDSVGLKFQLDLPNSSWGNDAYESVQRGDVEGVSFGFIVKDDKYSKIELDGKEILKRTILDVDLIEISPTAFPAYQDTEVNVRSLHNFKETEQRKLKQKQIAIELELL